MSRSRPTVGVLSPYVGGFYFATLLAGVQRAVRERRARLVVFQTAGLELFWPDEPNTPPLGWESIDGWIGVNDLTGRTYYERLAASGKPLVTLSTRLEGRSSCAVMPDNGAAQQAVRHLIEHGHRRIGFVGAAHHADLRERQSGYLAGLREAGIAPDPSLILNLGGVLEFDGREAGRHLIAAHLPCTALICGTDSIAIGIIQELQAVGLRVPEDLAVIGYDDIERAQYTNPPLSTIHMPFDVVAQRGADILLDHIVDGLPFPREVNVPGVLYARHSCGCRGRPESTMPLADTPETSEASQRERLTASVLALASAGRNLDPAAKNELRPSAARIAAHLRALVRGETGISSAEQHEVWRRLLAVNHDVETVDALLVLLEQTVGLWQKERITEAPPADHVQSGLRTLRFELMRAWRVVEQNRTRLVNAAAESSRKINLALIGTDLDKAEELGWLRWARVSHAILGEWKEPDVDAPRRLAIRSAFHAGDVPGNLRGRKYATSEFPSPALLDLLDVPESLDVLSIVPISGRTRNRGLLAVIAPIEAELADDIGSLAQWAALLSAAMDREELLSSLRGAVEREREFTETLRRSEERYALAAHGANDGLWDWDVTSGVVYLSPRWKAMLGYEDREIGSDLESWFSHVVAEDVASLRQVLESHLTHRKAHISHEYRMLHKDGRQVWVLCRGIVLFDHRGVAVRAAGSQTDITRRRSAEEQMLRSAMHDALTGLPNRALLADRLAQAIARAMTADKARFAVLFLDLDHFKTINDSLGHVAGDQLLVQIAKRLGECVKPIDTVARLGGDEFAIVVSDLENDEVASHVAVRIHEALRAPFEVGSHRVFTSASIGITLSSERHQHAEDYLRDADTAMYRAKFEGRARHQLFDGRMHEQAMERLSVEAGVRRALERSEFVLHYQPIVSLDTGAATGVEALIRWRHPERGILSPGAFLPVAEESGLIVAMSEWVLESACERAREWRDLVGPVRVSVNIPSAQLKDPALVELVRVNMLRSGLDGTELGLELVESSLIEHSVTIIDNLQRLRAMGVYISIDDFGTGYSSLSYLKRLPIDALKIDRSFTSGIPHDPNDSAISTAIIAMAQSLNVNVVAEGVETVEQSEFLRARGCQSAQGYFFARPLPADECLQFLRRTRQARRTTLGPRASSTGT